MCKCLYLIVVHSFRQDKVAVVPDFDLVIKYLYSFVFRLQMVNTVF